MVIYLDSGDWKDFSKYLEHVSGFTTNPTLLAGAEAKPYSHSASGFVLESKGKPLSLEVFADDLEAMEEQARFLSKQGSNVYVKIPITNTRGESTALLIHKLAREGLKINVTAITTMNQIRTIARTLYPNTPAIISIFCGRIADTGRDPVPFLTAALNCKHSQTQILWASAREVYNITQARQSGADIITISPALLDKHLRMNGKSLEEVSLDTVKQFHEDSKKVTF